MAALPSEPQSPLDANSPWGSGGEKKEEEEEAASYLPTSWQKPDQLSSLQLAEGDLKGL